MSKKYKVSFVLETDDDIKEDLRDVIWSLLQTGSVVYGPMSDNPTRITFPQSNHIIVKEVDEDSEFCDESYRPFLLFLVPPNVDFTGDITPVCTAARFHELSDAISDYKAQAKNIMVLYVPNGSTQAEGECVYFYDPLYPELGEFKRTSFFDDNPELD